MKTIKNELLVFLTVITIINTFIGISSIIIHFIKWNLSFLDLRVLIVITLFNIILHIARKLNEKIK